MHRIYLASTFARRPEMRGYRDELHALGHTVTSRWIDLHGDTATPDLNTYPDQGVSYATEDLADIDAAEVVISFTGHGGRGGRHVEFGYAIARQKRLILVGEREHIFHALPQVEHVADWPAARALLGDQD